MLNKLFANYHLKTKYNVTEKQIRPLINMAKYISFYAYRPYKDPDLTPSQKFIVHNMMSLRSGYYVVFDNFIQNEITHELVYNFILSVDESVRYDDLIEYFDELHGYGFFDRYKKRHVVRLREVLEIIKENNLNIRSVDVLSRKKLARKTIEDYKFFDHRIKKTNYVFASRLVKFVPKPIRSFFWRHKIFIISLMLTHILYYLFYF
ncbi:hypothetical protein [Pseudomonas extremaustralis]